MLKELAHLTGYKRDAIDHAIAAVPRAGRKSTSLSLTVALAQKLGFSTVFAVLCHARDELQRLSEPDEEEPTEPPDWLPPAVNELADEVDWLQQFAPGQRLGLALRAARIAGSKGPPITAETLAERALKRGELSGWQSAEKLAMAIRWFERGRGRMPNDTLRELVRVIDPQMSLRSLKERIQGMHDVHIISDTLELSGVDTGGEGEGEGEGRRQRRQHRRTGTRVQFLHPDLPGFEIVVNNTPLITHALSVDQIRVYQRGSGNRSLSRIVNAWHEGYEFGVVVQGRVRLTLKKTAFLEESLNSLPRFQVGKDEVILDQIFCSGDSIAFRPDIFHRIEFLDEENCVISLNIDHSVLLKRTTRHRRRRA